MKKYSRAARTVMHAKKDDGDIVRRAIIKTVSSVLCFCVVTGICKLPFEPCRKIKNEVVYFLQYSYDFKSAAVTAYERINEYINSKKVAPVLNESEGITEDNDTQLKENGD